MESIYKWIEPAPVRPERPPLYHSTHPVTSALAGSTIGKGKSTHNRTNHATLGTDQLKHTIQPDKFLKAGEKTGLESTVTRLLPASFTRDKGLPREAHMSIKDMMVGHKTAPKSSRDFVTENAISAILASPRSKQRPAEQDWLASKNFAKRPAYLDRIAAQLASEREYVLELADAQQRDAANHASGGSVREMAADERADLIAQLKAKWTEVSARYSLFAHRKISTTNSSVGEIRLKENCERLMDKLEKDINRLSIPAPIYISAE